MLAERVLRGPGVELIGRQIVLAAEKLEFLRRDDEVKKPLLPTDRAVAVGDAIQIGADAEAHAPAMTSALHCRLHHSGSDVRIIPQQARTNIRRGEACLAPTVSPPNPSSRKQSCR